MTLFISSSADLGKEVRFLPHFSISQYRDNITPYKCLSFLLSISLPLSLLLSFSISLSPLLLSISFSLSPSPLLLSISSPSLYLSLSFSPALSSLSFPSISFSLSPFPQSILAPICFYMSSLSFSPPSIEV